MKTLLLALLLPFAWAQTDLPGPIGALPDAAAAATSIYIWNGAQTFKSGFTVDNALAADLVWKLPTTDGSAGDSLVTDGAGVLSWNSSAGSPPFVDSTAIIKGSVTASKLLRFEVDGFTAATTNTLTPQNASYIIAGTNIANTFTQHQIIPTLAVGEIAMGGSLGSGDFFFYNAAGSQFVRLRPSTSTTTYTVTLPTGQGDIQDVMVNNDGAGTMVWKNPLEAFDLAAPLTTFGTPGSGTYGIQCSGCVTTFGTNTFTAVNTFDNFQQIFRVGLRVQNSGASQPQCQLGTGSLFCADSGGSIRFNLSGTTGAIFSSILSGSGTRCLQVPNSGIIELASAACGPGTVTSVATTGPITGGTITSTGTIACPSCVTAVTANSPLSSSSGTTPAISCFTCVTTDTTQTITGNKTFSGLVTISGTLDARVAGNLYTRSFSGAGGVSCSGVNDGWFGWDTAGQYLIMCAGNNRYRVNLVAY